MVGFRLEGSDRGNLQRACSDPKSQAISLGLLETYAAETFCGVDQTVSNHLGWMWYGLTHSPCWFMWRRPLLSEDRGVIGICSGRPSECPPQSSTKAYRSFPTTASSLQTHLRNIPESASPQIMSFDQAATKPSPQPPVGFSFRNPTQTVTP